MPILRRPSHRGAGSLKLILLVGITAVLSAGGVYLLYGQPVYEDADEAVHKDAAEPSASPAVVYNLGNFLVNVRTDGELRYLRVEVAAGIRGYHVAEAGGGHGEHGGGDDELPSLRSEDEAVARDLVVRILSDASFTSLRTAAGRAQAKTHIKQALDEMLEEAQVESVLFLAFVMQ